MNKKITVKLEKKIFKSLTNEEFKEKVKKIKGLYKETKKIANQIKYEKEEKLKSDLKLNKLADPDREPAMKTQVTIIISWLNQQIYY